MDTILLCSHHLSILCSDDGELLLVKLCSFCEGGSWDCDSESALTCNTYSFLSGGHWYSLDKQGADTASVALQCQWTNTQP